MKMSDTNRIILKTALNTLLVIILGIMATIAGLTVFSPKTIAHAANLVGFNSISLKYSELAYNKSKDINDLYYVLSESISQNKNSNIVRYFPILYDNSNYYTFIAYVETQNLARTNNYNLKISLANEDGFLKAQYTAALYNVGQKSNSANFALTDLVNNLVNAENFNWAMGAYITEFIIDEDRDTSVFTGTVNDLMQEYYDYLCDLYDSTGNTDRLYICTLLNAIVNVNLSMTAVTEFVTTGYNLAALASDYTYYSALLTDTIALANLIL